MKAVGLRCLWTLVVVALLGGVLGTTCANEALIEEGKEVEEVTFRYVPLEGEEISSISLSGSMNRWGEMPMARREDGSWTVTIFLKHGNYAYKFVINNQWPGDMEAARGGDPVDLDADGYVHDGFMGQNAVRHIGGEPPFESVSLNRAATVSVATLFRFMPPPRMEVTSVSLRGSFNHWGETPMERQEDGSWTVTINLKPGTYAYKFFVNCRWPQDMENWLDMGPVDPSADEYIYDFNAGQNAVRIIEAPH
jgi:hypothetical protein